MKIALIQMSIVKNKEKNLETAKKMIHKACNEGAEIVVLPEMFNCPYNSRVFKDYSETKSGKTITLMRTLARQHKIVIIAGSIVERDHENLYNTSFIINTLGEIIAKHRKAHLFDVDIPNGIRFKESRILKPGNKATVVKTTKGTLGVAICYDMRFPELIRKMTLLGAEMIFIPAAFNMTTGPAHWHTIARSRALDNQVYFALCSPARDTSSSYVAYGHSLVTNPWGEIINELNKSPGILYSEIDFEQLKKVRTSLPLLKHRRPDLYTVAKK